VLPAVHAINVPPPDEPGRVKPGGPVAIRTCPRSKAARGTRLARKEVVACGGVRLVVYERVMRFESRSRRKQILALRRWLILAAAVLAVFATVLPWGWTAGVHAGDGQVIVVLAAVGMFAVLRYREHRVGMMLVGEAVLGVIVASTAVVHFAWGERGPGLALLLLAGPLWLAGAAAPSGCIRWVAAAFVSAEGPGGAWVGRDSSKRCPECHERITLSARICRCCGLRFDDGVGWVERPPLSTGGRSGPGLSAKSFVDSDDRPGRSERWRESA
jgi:hypothetical protein